ncbi:hypothetical protein HPB49_012151 [Dermacentor silvarum]|uniref:Uncharacterized protein n=1 Tax=Dermacentor silvarum TaxID=543639 RepID=A0ACB8E025_DERSI|nr:hypothetical protein HPB49_012151 [Dermacentor silvarum]
MRVSAACSSQAISPAHLPVLQRAIESRSVLVKFIMRRCEALRAGKNVAAKNSAPSPPQLPPSHAKPAALDSAAECPSCSIQPLFAKDAQRIRRVAANLEKRWHALWLRSLEWQRMLEQLLQGSQGIWETGGDCYFGDEPNTKQPRLSCEWEGGISNNGTEEPRAEDELTAVVATTTECGPPEMLENGIMVGQTGIMDLKLARKGRRCSEVFNDVGYSSESSPQLSSEDCIRIHSYSPELAEVVLREHRDGLARDDTDECGTGVVDSCAALYNAADEEDAGETREYEASPLIQSNVSNVDFYKMPLPEEAPSSDHNEDDAVDASGKLDDELMDIAELEQLGGAAKVSYGRAHVAPSSTPGRSRRHGTIARQMRRTIPEPVAVAEAGIELPFRDEFSRGDHPRWLGRQTTLTRPATSKTASMLAVSVPRILDWRVVCTAT